MSAFIQEILTAFSAFVDWSFSTPSGLGVSIGALLVAINVIGLIGLYLLHRYK